MRSLTITEKYLWRPQSLRYLRVEQLVRYFYIKDIIRHQKKSVDNPTRGFTTEWREEHDLHDDNLHPNNDDP